MSQSKKNQNVVYRCPLCLNQLNDVTIDKDKDGIYRCLKCSYQGTYEDMLQKYETFRFRYRLKDKRITLEEQKNM